MNPSEEIKKKEFGGEVIPAESASESPEVTVEHHAADASENIDQETGRFIQEGEQALNRAVQSTELPQENVEEIRSEQEIDQKLVKLNAGADKVAAKAKSELDPYIVQKRERRIAPVRAEPVETKVYETKEGVSIEIAFQEFNLEGGQTQEATGVRKDIIFLPGVGLDVGTKTAKSVAEAFARSPNSEGKVNVITSKIRKEVEDSLYQQAEAIAKVIEEKGMSEITLVGHSQGGDKAIDLVSILQKDKNLKINGLVLLDSVGLYEQKSGELAKGFFKDSMVNTPADLVAGKQQNRLSSMVKGLISGNDISAGIVKDLWNIWRSGANLKRRVASEASELAKVNPRLGEVECPVIVMSGTKDPISNPEKLVPAAEEQKLREKNEAAGVYADPREEYLRKNFFPKSPYMRMVAPEKLGHHGLPLFRGDGVADGSLGLLERFRRSQKK